MWIGLEGGMVGWGSESGLGCGRVAWWPDIDTPTELFEKLLPDPGVWRSSSVACDVEQPTIRVQALHIGAGFHK